MKKAANPPRYISYANKTVHLTIFARFISRDGPENGDNPLRSEKRAPRIFSTVSYCGSYQGSCQGLECIFPLPPIFGVDGCDCEETLKLIAEGKLDTEPLITHTYPLSKIDEAYELFENKRDGVIKVAVECSE